MDIFCLQELDKRKDLDQIFADKYRGIHCIRPHNKPDSSSIYYDISKYEILEFKRISFAKFDDFFKKNDFSRPNCGIVCAFKVIDDVDEFVFIVACCHLFWNPNFEGFLFLHYLFFFHFIF